MSEASFAILNIFAENLETESKLSEDSGAVGMGTMSQSLIELGQVPLAVSTPKTSYREYSDSL